MTTSSKIFALNFALRASGQEAKRLLWPAYLSAAAATAASVEERAGSGCTTVGILRLRAPGSGKTEVILMLAHPKQFWLS